MSSSPITLTTAQLLKNKTAFNHAQLEEVLLPYLQRCATPEVYAGILRSFYGFFAPLEVLIQQQVNSSVIPDMHQRRKAELILDDLGFVGGNEPLLVCTTLPSITTMFEALGAMYVLEGSTLGGRGITKMLLKTNPSWQEEMRFFSGYGESTGQKWTLFVATINTYVAEEEVTGMVAAADDCFLKFRCWLEHCIKTGAVKSL